MVPLYGKNIPRTKYIYIHIHIICLFIKGENSKMGENYGNHILETNSKQWEKITKHVNRCCCCDYHPLQKHILWECTTQKQNRKCCFIYNHTVNLKFYKVELYKILNS